MYCPPGVYDLDKGLVIANQKSNGEFGFVSFQLSGHISAYSPNQNIGSTTVFKLKKPTFGVALHLARNCIVQNIVFEGCADYNHEKIKNINWSEPVDDSNSMTRGNLNSPSCAVVIDPFHKNIPTKNRYPGFDGYYSNKQTGGSSMVLIKGCSFFKHYIAIANNPSGQIANGDNIKVEQSSASLCHTFWSCGQSQSRANHIDNVYVTFINTFINGRQIGSQNGTPPMVRNLNLAGFCKQVLNVNTGFSGMNFSQCYMEGIWSLGVCNSDFVSFDQCQIKFIPPGEDYFMPPFFLHSNNVATFRDCDIQFFNNCTTPMPILFNSRSLVISGGLIEAGVVVAGGYTNAGGDALHNVELDNVFIKCKGKVAGGSTSAKPKTDLRKEIVMGGQTYESSNGTLTRNLSTTYFNYFIESVELQINNDSKKATFLSNTPGLYQIGDNLFSSAYVSPTHSEMRGPIKIRSAIGYIEKIEGNAIYVAGIPKGLDNSRLDLYCVSYPTVPLILNGDSKSNSNKLINVDFSKLSWKPSVGDRVYSPYFHPGAYIIRIDLSRQEIEMSALSRGISSNRSQPVYEYKRLQK